MQERHVAGTEIGQYCFSKHGPHFCLVLGKENQNETGSFALLFSFAPHWSSEVANRKAAKDLTPQTFEMHLHVSKSLLLLCVAHGDAHLYKFLIPRIGGSFVTSRKISFRTTSKT